MLDSFKDSIYIMQTKGTRYIFGGDAPWNTDDWTASDDRVRGGSSVSHLTLLPSGAARFHGNLDTSTLGGAGFASQRTKGTLSLDLSGTSGLGFRIANSDGKRYIITLKDEIPEKRPDGRENSGVSWEADFASSGQDGKGVVDGSVDVFVPWKAFKATYRGRDRPDEEPLDLKNVKRVSFMMRSFFDQQKGDFSIDIESVTAVPECGGGGGKSSIESGTTCRDDDSHIGDEKAQANHNEGRPTQQPRQQEPRKGWKGMFCGLL